VQIQLELHRSIVRPAVNDDVRRVGWHNTNVPTLADGDVVRRLYQAFTDRDFAAAESCFAADVVWHLPGDSPIAGDHHGWVQIRDNFMAKLGPLSGGTLRVELVDVAIGDVFVVAVQHATASSGGKTLDVTACQLITVRDGLIQEIRGHYSDQEALDAILR
jgi:ketosteroid isomerase-like protein